MTGVTRAGVRWPWRVALLWLASVVALAIIGIPLDRKLDPPQLVLAGGSAAQATDLGHGHFGEDSYVLLEGTRADLRRYGPFVVAGLEKETGAPMVSPFSGLGGRTDAALWPRGGPAVVVLNLGDPATEVPAATLDRLHRVVRSVVHPPLKAIVTGPAPLRQAITDQSLAAASSASLIAFPALLIVLLLVFRSVVAAVVPLAVAGATVLGGKGILLLLAKVIHVDATSDVLLSMIGLALGVDYSLLIVTRYREAVAAGDSRGHAVHVAAHTAGKTASFAGLVLTGILGVTLVLAPRGAISSAAAGAIVATAMSVFSALVVVPALLTLLGRWISPLPEQRRGLLGKVVDGALRRPWPALLAAVPLIVVAIGATKLNTVPPNPLVLPSNSPGGQALAALGATRIGPSFNVVVSRPSGPLTARSVLGAERRLEASIAQLTPVDAVIGPASVTRLAREDASVARALRAGVSTTHRSVTTVAGAAATTRVVTSTSAVRAASPPATSGLASGIASAGAAAAALSSRAAQAARSVQTGAGRTAAPLGSLAAGLGAVSHSLQTGGGSITAAGASAAAAAAQLQQAETDLHAMSVGSLDPRYRAVESDLAAVIAALGSGNVPGSLQGQLAAAQTQLAQAGGRVSTLTGDAHADAAAAADAARTPSPATRGLTGLAAAASALRADLARVGAQAASIGVKGSGAGGRTTTTTTVTPAATRVITRSLSRTRTVGTAPSPPASGGAGFDALASASTAGAVRLAAARYVLDVAGGGAAGRISVLTGLGLNDPRTAGLLARIERLTDAFAQRTGVRAAVGGQAAEMLQFSQKTKSSLPLIIIGVALITFLALVAVLRSIMLAAIAVGLNLLTVLTMFGIMSFLYVGAHPVLGRSGALDVITTVGIFAITFALSIDYQVFLLARMREGYLESQDSVKAIRFGVEHTARIVTGAALIMLATFAAFGTTAVSSVQQFGIGLGVAIAIDATVVRLVLLPAMLRLFGERTWWLPDRLERQLPELDVEGFSYVRARNELATRAADVW